MKILKYKLLCVFMKYLMKNVSFMFIPYLNGEESVNMKCSHDFVIGDELSPI